MIKSKIRRMYIDKLNGETYKIYVKVLRIYKWMSFAIDEMWRLMRDIYHYVIIFRYPRVIQFPITYKCNFDCVMCGMKNLLRKSDLTPEEYGNILDDKLYKKVVAVGINGGEPFIRKDLRQCIEVIIKKCPKLKEFYFISNGFFVEKICDDLHYIKSICECKGINIGLSISIDGFEKIQDLHRGKEKAFEKAEKTLKRILENKSEYVDSVGVICTITSKNIEYIEQFEAWVSKYPVTVSYNIATVNERIDNYSKVDDFSVMSNYYKRMLAQEFFYKKFIETKEERYYSLFLYLKTGKRYYGCPCQYNSWVTLTPDGEVCYCATHSKELGSAEKDSSYNIFNSNIKYLKELKNIYCENCSHYSENLNFSGSRILHKELMSIDDWG